LIERWREELERGGKPRERSGIPSLEDELATSLRKKLLHPSVPI